MRRTYISADAITVGTDQSAVVKGRNRDTAWFWIVDTVWPELKQAHRQWLHAENFTEGGQQKMSLSQLTAKVRAALNPQ